MPCHTADRHPTTLPNSPSPGMPQRTTTAKLAPIRASWETGKAIEWVQVHRLPDHVFFDHSIHLHAGVGCVTCHGRVDEEEIVKVQKPLSMGWCLECHRDVQDKQGDSAFIRPVAQMTNMQWTHDSHVEPPRHLNPPQNCWGCHR